MSIHREGRKILFYLLIFLFLVNAALQYADLQEWIISSALATSIVIYLLVLQFFRNPTVPISLDENKILAPADGKIVVIEQTMEQEYFHDERIQISIFMSPLNVHVNRSPMAGKVKYFKYHPGKYLVAWHPKSSTENERTTMVLEHSGTQILVRQVAGAVARRIKWYVKEGQELKQGAEYGFIKFGSRLDVFLPVGSKIEATLNQEARGGKTVLATLEKV